MNEAEQPDYLLRECQVIDENCLYTAQAHFILAERSNRMARWMLVGPSVVGGLCGILTTIGLPNWVGAVSAVCGIVTGVASALGVDKKAASHRQAATALTALRHEARALSETFWRDLSHEQLVNEVCRLDMRYNDLVRLLEGTDQKAFEEARRRVRDGVRESDFETGEISRRSPL